MEEVYSETVIVKFSRSDSTLSGSDPMKSANINVLKADLKEKKDALKKVQKEVATLEAKKAKADEILKKLK